MTSTIQQPPPSTPWWKKTWVRYAAVAVVCLGIGGALGSGEEADPTASSEYKELAAQLDDANTEALNARQAQSDAEEALGDLPDREAAVEDRENKVGQRELAVEKAEEAVAKREKRVGIVEDRIAANTVAGEGMYQVGKDMAPGTYKTSGRSGCYYAVLNSSDTFDIAENNNVNGPAYVTVSEGQYFETTRCADWIKQ